MGRIAAILLLALISLIEAPAQHPTKPASKPVAKTAVKPAPKRTRRVVSFTAMGGAGWPIAKQSLTDFWRYGPNVMFALTTPVSRRLALGISYDFTVLRFSYAGFAEKYPKLTPPDRKVTWMNVFLLARYEFTPQKQISPYVQLSFGPSRLTPASFTGVVDSVKKTYYEIHPRSRLALGVSAGVEIDMAAWLAWVTEINGVFVYNDTEAGMRVVLRGGFKFTW